LFGGKNLDSTNRYLIIIFLGFLLVNIVFLVHNILRFKQIVNEKNILEQTRQSLIQLKLQTESVASQLKTSTNKDFYGLPCPEVSFNSISGEVINLSDLLGNVILLRFSRFYKSDLANLIYLQHLAEKYKDEGVSFVFINSQGKHHIEATENLVDINFPIIEDDGDIMALFNASFEDLIIIDRDFTIKFKYFQAPKSIIFNEAMKWTNPRGSVIEFENQRELKRVIYSLAFYDVIEKRKKDIRQFLNKNIILILFTSTCLGCEENARIRLFVDIASKINTHKTEIIVLFGKGNYTNPIEQFALMNGLDNTPISTGVICDFEKLKINDYYSLFDLQIDPRIFILDKKGEIIFSEDFASSSFISFDFIMRKL